MNSFHLPIIAITYFPAATAPTHHSSLCFDTYLTLTTAIDILEPMNGKLVSGELYKLWKHQKKHIKEMHRRNEHKISTRLQSTQNT